MAILSAALGLSPEIDRMTTQSRSELEVEKAKGWGRQEGCMDAERVTSTVSSQTFNSTLRSSLGFDPAKHSWLDKKEQLKSEYAKSQFSRISIPGPCGTSSYADMKDRAERGFHSGAVEGLSSRLDALAVSEGPSAPPRSAPEFELQNTEDDTMVSGQRTSRQGKPGSPV